MKGRVFDVEIDPGRVRAAEEAFEEILILQNLRFQESMERWPILSRRNALRALRILTPVATWLSAYLTISLMPCPWALAAPTGLLTVALGLFSASLIYPGIDGWESGLQRCARKLCGWQARLLVARTERLCPFRATYTIDEGSITAEIPELKIRKGIRAGKVRFAARSGGVLCLYDRALARRWAVLLYLGNEEMKAEVAAFLEKHGIETLGEKGQKPSSVRSADSSTARRSSDGGGRIGIG
ncbi:MAG: hypothetical protein RL885_31965 [Planctomycetota bacterium]